MYEQKKASITFAFQAFVMHSKHDDESFRTKFDVFSTCYEFNRNELNS